MTRAGPHRDKNVGRKFVPFGESNEPASAKGNQVAEQWYRFAAGAIVFVRYEAREIAFSCSVQGRQDVQKYPLPPVLPFVNK